MREPLECLVMDRRINIFNFLVVTSLIQMISANLEKDLRLLSRILPGVYSNRQQYLRDASLSPAKRHKSVQAIFRPVELTFLPGAFNLYVEKYSNYHQMPFKQWIYSFETNHTDKAIKLRLFEIASTSKRQNLARNVKTVDRLNTNDLKTRPECDMTWRRLKLKTFHGTAGRNCMATVSSEKVREIKAFVQN